MPSDRSADRHATPRHPVGMPQDEWDEFGELVGDRNRSAVLRKAVRALLGKPGARMPKRSDYQPKVKPAEPT
jgi:hypothetical protein